MYAIFVRISIASDMKEADVAGLKDTFVFSAALPITGQLPAAAFVSGVGASTGPLKEAEKHSRAECR